MEAARVSYDSDRRELVYSAGEVGEVLVDRSVMAALSAIGRGGTHEGRPVTRVVVAFGDETAARYNAQPLSFLGLVARYPGGEVEGPRFEVREDFGIR